MREIPHLKIHLIGLSWSAVLILFPAINESIEVSLFWVGFAHYCYVVAVAIPFDIRDTKYDQPKQKTIPQVIGIPGARVLALLLLVVFTLIMLYLNHNLWFNWLFYVSVLTQMGLIIMMNVNRSDMYTAGWIDGAIAILGLSYFFAL